MLHDELTAANQPGPGDAGEPVTTAISTESPVAGRRPSRSKGVSTTTHTLGLRIRPGTTADLDAIYTLRHDVYAVELGQHLANREGRLDDAADVSTEFLVAERGGALIGFIGVTSPTSPRYAIEKYLPRSRIPLDFDRGPYEVRALTIAPAHRHGLAALLLMRAAWDAVRKAGGDTIFVMGRAGAVEMYRKVGLKPVGVSFTAGSVPYEVMAASVTEIASYGHKWKDLTDRLASAIPADSAGPPEISSRNCYHGGAFFGAIGDDFDDLGRRHGVISADVLDAWFPPSPAVVRTLQEELPWILSTSPPTHGEGLVRTISEVRGVPSETVVLGAGSSALIFSALRRWLDSSSRVLILDPMYSEYEHVLSSVVGCQVDKLTLDPANGFRLDRERLVAALLQGYDLVIIVNPNNPTGVHLPVADLRAALASANPKTRVWIDEAYVEYAGEGQSLESLAASSDHVVVCKSLSKVYALSGVRAAYLIAHPDIATDLRVVTPPWAVSLPAQVAAVRALQDPTYYRDRYAETRVLRANLRMGLSKLAPWNVTEGVINSVLCLTTPEMPKAAAIVSACRVEGLFLRDWPLASSSLGTRALRVSVKDDVTNVRIVETLGRVLTRLMGS
jgi:histidinol-phosphate/aromatic aminotransferase/cobyric acid decarboxylase-like protein/predicted GNAT family N-acyltransferase